MAARQSYRFPVATLSESRDGKGKILFNKRASEILRKGSYVYLTTTPTYLYFTLFDRKVDGAYKLYQYEPSSNLGCNFPVWLFPKNMSGHYRMHRVNHDSSRYAIRLNEPLEKEESI